MRVAAASAVPLLTISLAGFATSQSPPTSAIAEVGRLLQAGKIDRALELLDERIAASPNDSVLHWQRAYVNGCKGDYDGGVRDATRAIELDPRNHRAFIERGYLQGKRKAYQAAIADFDRAIAIEPREATAFGDRGDVRQAIGEFEAAIADYTEAIRLQPSFGPAFLNRGHCWRALGKQMEARADYRKAQQLLPREASIWLDIADVEANAGQWPHSIQSVTKAIELAPDDVKLVALRGRDIWRSGDAEKAIPDLAKAASEAPDPVTSADASLSLGCVQLCRGEAEAASKAFAAAAARGGEALGNWALLMRWCAQSRIDGKHADAELAAVLAAPPHELSPLQRELMALITRGEGDGDDLPLRDRDCAVLFFSGWRAECRGDREEALRKFMRAANTGSNDWLQWQVAVDHVRRWTAAKPLATGFGVELGEVPGGAGLEVVRVVAGGAASLQGLAVGDVILTLNHDPATKAQWHEVQRHLQVGLPLRLTVRRGKESVVCWLRGGFESG